MGDILESRGGDGEQLRDNLAHVEETITKACRRAGRARNEVQLMAVSKMHTPAAIREAAGLGITLFGENKVQEFAGKRRELGSALDGISVHLIGHLQGNKAGRAAELFDSVDSVDSARLAERLESAAAKLGKRLPVLVEIKLSGEESKSGLTPESAELADLWERLVDFGHLQMRGVMTVPPYLRDAEAVRPYFRRLRELRDGWAQQYPRLDFGALSMGMTHDFAVAIEEGATEVRVGTGLFGAREYT